MSSSAGSTDTDMNRGVVVVESHPRAALRARCLAGDMHSSCQVTGVWQSSCVLNSSGSRSRASVRTSSVFLCGLRVQGEEEVWVLSFSRYMEKVFTSRLTQTMCWNLQDTHALRHQHLLLKASLSVLPVRLKADALSWTGRTSLWSVPDVCCRFRWGRSVLSKSCLCLWNVFFVSSCSRWS